MSDPFHHQDYHDYFQSLENRLKSQKSSSPAAPRSRPNPPSRRFRVIRLRPQFFIALLAIILAVVLLIVLFAKKGKSSTPKVSGGQTESHIEADQTQTDVPAVIAFTETGATVDIPSDNDAESAIVINTVTQEVIARRAPHQRLHPASLTKIMTVLVATEQIENYSDTFTMTIEITDAVFLKEASAVGFSPGEKITMTDLLYGTILESGADAALGLAFRLAGSEEGFVRLMNQKAAALGLEDTHFTNVTGLYDADHYSSAYDIAVILQAAMNNEICRTVLSTFQHTTAATEQHPDGIKLTSTLFSYMYGTEPETATIVGGKTGFVNESKFCIASFGQNNTTQTEYIAVTLKNSSRWPAVFGQIDLYKQFAK